MKIGAVTLLITTAYITAVWAAHEFGGARIGAAMLIGPWILFFLIFYVFEIGQTSLERWQHRTKKDSKKR
jgi:sterol desaturase/sphingolipid hydroxylase (fatty acid hydroxylase superfamily)